MTEEVDKNKQEAKIKDDKIRCRILNAIFQ